MGLFARIGRTKATGSTLSTPGETPVAVPMQYPTTPLPTRAPMNFAGVDSGRGTLAGGALARGAGTTAYTGTELIDHRGDPNDFKVIDPNTFVTSKPSATLTNRYRAGKNWTAFYRIAPNRDWGVYPFNSNHHAQIRRPHVRVSTRMDGASGGAAGYQNVHGQANPVVARDRPMPWDQGIIRGGSV